MDLEHLPLESIGETELRGLIEAGVAEQVNIDYKQDRYGGREQDRKEFLKDATSFANTQGGHLIIGMTEKEGIPTRLSPLTGFDTHAELSRLESMLRDSAQPRLLGVQSRVIQVTGGSVILLRIPRSFNSPHRVGYQGWNKFFVRNSAGAHEASVDELRELFLLLTQVAERVRQFRSQRLELLQTGSAARRVDLRPGVVLHVVPLAAASRALTIDVGAAYDDCAPFVPIGGQHCHRYFNFDGMLTTTGDDESAQSVPAFCQVFRSGCVETARGYSGAASAQAGRLHVPRQEEMIVQHTRRIVSGLARLGVAPPFVVMPTLMGVKGLKPSWKHAEFDPPLPFERDTLVLPELLLQSSAFPDGWADAFKPVFDPIWQGAGVRRSPGFDGNGKWTGHS
ncbi:MAG: ATP-binding protein [Proteobacteria bacterium]|nr:ATP-binding protein [Pseudomonadota bacterium]